MPNPNAQKNALHKSTERFFMGRGGFEPPKSATADLQSAPFGHSGTYPYKRIFAILQNKNRLHETV